MRLTHKKPKHQDMSIYVCIRVRFENFWEFYFSDFLFIFVHYSHRGLVSHTKLHILHMALISKSRIELIIKQIFFATDTTLNDFRVKIREMKTPCIRIHDIMNHEKPYDIVFFLGWSYINNLLFFNTNYYFNTNIFHKLL